MSTGRTEKRFLILIMIGALAGAFWPADLQADKVEELKQKIQGHSGEIERLNQEIAEYQTKLSETKKKSNTLETAIERIDTTRQKLASNINLTEQEIGSTELTLEKLALEINATRSDIRRNKETIAETIRQINFINQDSLVEVFLTQNSLSDFLQQSNALEKIQDKLENHLGYLRNKQAILTNKQSAEEVEKEELNTLKQRLSGQKTIIDQQRQEQGALLASTKNQESSYQSLLQERLERKRQIEAEIKKIEAQIKVQIDPNSLPTAGQGVLLWPLANVRITQYFGNTPFASQNAQVYSGKGHNGIDLAADIGTPVLAAAAGQVIGIDDTDRACPGASYGKWVLIRHNNGLSTLYAHLSYTNLQEGDTVKAGQEIAYSGNTGYTTGPHLHFEVLASQAVRITDGINELKSKSCAGAVYRLPLSGYNGKLNPLSYL